MLRSEDTEDTMMIPCYVGGKGKAARDVTKDFKVAVFEVLESTGLGYDTRYRYYRRQYPAMRPDQFARMVCAPIEDYDREWPEYRARHSGSLSEEEVLTAFVWEKDAGFRAEARAAIFCYNEAGLGTGINSMRLLADGKPLLGFFLRDPMHGPVNVQNILQLKRISPSLVTLVRYDNLTEVAESVRRWLIEMAAV
jgi:hypothetical protein